MNIRLHATYTDEQLLTGYRQSKDSAWLGHLLQRYTLLLLGVGLQYLKEEQAAKDAVQQVFVKVIGNFQQYEVTHFKSWLYKVMVNECLMILRKKQLATQPLHPQVEEKEDADWEALWQKEETLNLLESALGELSIEQSQSVKLFYLEQKSYQEIATLTGYSLLQVKSYIQNGKRNLKIIISKKRTAHD